MGRRELPEASLAETFSFQRSQVKRSCLYSWWGLMVFLQEKEKGRCFSSSCAKPRITEQNKLCASSGMQAATSAAGLHAEKGYIRNSLCP